MRWFHVPGPTSSCPSYLPGLYTSEEIDDLVFVQGFIPVASGAEFVKINTGAFETMGGGTCWSGNYTTGLSKKYVQVMPVDFTGILSIGFTPQSEFIYDGNEMGMANFQPTPSTSVSVHLFSSNLGYTARNMRMSNFTIDKLTGTKSGPFGGCGGTISNNFIFSSSITCTNESSGLVSDAVTGCTITNCLVSLCTVSGSNVYGVVNGPATVSYTDVLNTTLTGTGRAGGIGITENVSYCKFSGGSITAGSVGSGTGGINASNAPGIIEYCVVENTTINANMSIVCGIGQARGGATIRHNRIENVNINVTGPRNRVGGISGLFFGGTNVVEQNDVINCNISAPNSVDVGGIIGYDQNLGTMRNNRVIGGTVHGSSRVGGLIGRISLGTTVCQRSFSTAAITGGSLVGGAIGQSVVNANTLELYWDTVTSGNATSAGGAQVIGQTTVALQAPVAPTGIYASWSALIWSFGTSNQYPSLINVP